MERWPIADFLSVAVTGEAEAAATGSRFVAGQFGIRILERGAWRNRNRAGALSDTPLFCTYRHGRKNFADRVAAGSVPGIDSGGNLVVRGPNLMEGYLLYGLGIPSVDGWYATGDVVSVDSVADVCFYPGATQTVCQDCWRDDQPATSG